jgi:signal transduction histidine kinase
VLRTRPLKTSTFRLTLAYLGLFSLSSAMILGIVYWMSARFSDQQVRAVIGEEVAWLSDQLRAGGLAALKRSVDERSAVEPNRRAIYLLLDPLGVPMAGNISRWPDVVPDGDGYVSFPIEVHESGSGPPKSHPATAKVFANDAGYSLLVGRDVHDLVQSQQQIKAAILLGIGAIIALGLLGGLILSRWMLTRLERINRSTSRIMAGEFGRRIATHGNGDEFDDLAQNLNAMLDRIERLLAGMRQVSEDIAHDLRTPLNRMRSRIEVALMGAPDSEESRALLEDTLRDADGLIETFNALLAIARAEAGAQHGDWERLDLAELARDVAELYEPLAEEASITLRLDARDGAFILGHRQLVAQAIANVADNAIKYTPAGGTVAISTIAQPTPAVTITDTGPGIPVDQRERAKQRFVRLDAQRSTPGSGLGLSLVDAVAKLHEARLMLADNAPGLKVTLSFKPAPAARVEADRARAA